MTDQCLPKTNAHCCLPVGDIFKVDGAPVELPLDLLDLVHLKVDHPQHLRDSGLAPPVIQDAAIFTDLELIKNEDTESFETFSKLYEQYI